MSFRANGRWSAIPMWCFQPSSVPAWLPACAIPVAGVGGMNHFLLPGSADAISSGGDATRYGVHLMELLINGLLKKGARRDRLEAKIFGGAKTIARFSNVGEQNALFARQFLMDEGIQVVGESTGGDHGRKLEYWPLSGRARQYALTGVEAQKAVAQEQASKTGAEAGG